MDFIVQSMYPMSVVRRVFFELGLPSYGRVQDF